MFEIIIETIESKSNGSKIILNLMRTRRIPNKGPFLANIPLEHMVQMETEFKPVNSQAPSQVCYVYKYFI